jgi:hypothetical protein
MPTKGRTKDELIKIAQQSGGNVKFAESRKESDLTPQDIIGYATFAENDPQWFNKPVAERLAVAQKALDAGAVRERNGTIDVDFSKIGLTPAPAGQTVQTAQPAGQTAPTVVNQPAPQEAVKGQWIMRNGQLVRR